jgi:hypothetical protein
MEILLVALVVQDLNIILSLGATHELSSPSNSCSLDPISVLPEPRTRPDGLLRSTKVCYVLADVVAKLLRVNGG